MSPSLVNASAAEARGRPGSSFAAASCIALPSPTGVPVMEWTEEEDGRVVALAADMKNKFYGVLADMLLEDIWPMATIGRVLVCGEALGPDIIKQMELIFRKAFRGATVALEDVRRLAEWDARAPDALAEAAFPKAFCLVGPTFFSGDLLPSYLGGYLGFLRRRSPSNPLWMAVTAAFDRLDLMGLSVAFRYDAVYVSPWTPSAQFEEEHRRLHDSIRAWSRPGGDFDEAMVLMAVLAAVFSDDLALTVAPARSAARGVRETTLLLMARYLRRIYGSRAKELLMECLRIENVADEAFRIHSQMLPV